MLSPTLLVIEDSTEDVALMLSALDKILPRDQVLVLPSGEEALDYLFTSDQRPALGNGSPLRAVILDLNLPGISGLEVLKRIRSQPGTHILPVIVLSASVEQRDIRAAARAGANSYVRKSLDHSRLAEAIQTMARYWLELNVNPFAVSAPQPASPRQPWLAPRA